MCSGVPHAVGTRIATINKREGRYRYRVRESESEREIRATTAKKHRTFPKDMYTIKVLRERNREREREGEHERRDGLKLYGSTRLASKAPGIPPRLSLAHTTTACLTSGGQRQLSPALSQHRQRVQLAPARARSLATLATEPGREHRLLRSGLPGTRGGGCRARPSENSDGKTNCDQLGAREGGGTGIPTMRVFCRENFSANSWALAEIGEKNGHQRCVAVVCVRLWPLP